MAASKKTITEFWLPDDIKIRSCMDAVRRRLDEEDFRGSYRGPSIGREDRATLAFLEEPTLHRQLHPRERNPATAYVFVQTCQNER